jgi:feruloyl esterase
MRVKKIAVLAGAAVAGSIIASAAQASDKCADLAKLVTLGVNVTVTKAERLEAGPPPPSQFGPPATYTLPKRCEVEGVIEPRTGADGKPYGVGFAVALPSSWSGQLLFQGGGGLDGVLAPPIGSVAAGSSPALARGMAVASTDSGHRSQSPFDGSFFADQQAAIDFEYASIGKVTAVAKAIVAKYYGKAAEHSYFAGCSMGGREAMIAAQRYPLEFDGVVAGAPAMRVGFSGIGDSWVSTTLAAIAPKDEKGNAVSSQALSDADRTLVVTKLLDACDAQDGVKDGMIFAVNACGFDPMTLACKGGKNDGCLSPQQAEAIAKAFAGPKDSRGVQVYPGFYYDTGVDAKGFIAGLLQAAPGPRDVGPVPTSIDVDARAAEAASDPLAAMGDTAGFVDLTSFSTRGGKMIFFHGVSDPWFSAKDTIGYYTRLGDSSEVQSWSRLFLAPGMGHCGGGSATLDQFDLLTSLTDWVEKGKAPDSVVATGAAFPKRSRPLCAWPKHAQYVGKGDSEDAKSFSCKE